MGRPAAFVATLAVGLVVACSIAPSPPETSIGPTGGSPEAPTGAPTTGPGASDVATSPVAMVTPKPAPAHRISVRTLDGEPQLWDEAANERFVPRGMNYIRLDDYHNTFGAASYDAPRAEAALARMAEGGFNVVRVFIDHRRGGIATVGGRLSGTYLANVADFLARAKAHGLVVMLTGEWLPDDGSYAPIQTSQVEGVNSIYLTSSGVAATVRFWRLLVTGLLELEAPTDAIFAYSLRNEQNFVNTDAPLDLMSGILTIPDGSSHDLADPDAKAAAIDLGLIHWFDETRIAIRELDPTALVTVGFFQPHGPNPNRIGDPRHVQTERFIRESSADFVDLHLYPGLELTLDEYMENFGVAGFEGKPLVMGEFGVFRFVARGTDVAATTARYWQRDSCAVGFDGWLYWTWDTDEQGELHSATELDGAIEAALSPLRHPDPCVLGP